MIQDIFPHIFHNDFKLKVPDENGFFLYFKDGCLLFDRKENGPWALPKFHSLKETAPGAMSHCDYLFSIDESDFYLVDEAKVSLQENEFLAFYKTSLIRDIRPMWVSFAAASAGQLHRFYKTNRFCGCCGAPMEKGASERSMVCSSCRHTVYPKISPAVIVAIINEGKLLLTKYAGREYTRYALVAGYTEFGETLEETVKREVMEEVGLKVKNLRYYKNQPWAFSDSILVGYWAELDGSPQVRLDETELSTAVWMAPEDIPDDFTDLSLTHEMILLFKNGYYQENNK